MLRSLGLVVLACIRPAEASLPAFPRPLAQVVSLRNFYGTDSVDHGHASRIGGGLGGGGGGDGGETASLLVVHPRKQPHHMLQEALRLAESYTGKDCMHLSVGPKNIRPTPSTYFGRGVVEDVAAQCEALGAGRVFVNAMLSGVQQRNLEAAWARPVLDRVALILGIFLQRARTHEARLQVELAELDYRASRLVRMADPNTGKRRGFGERGELEVVSARERGRSGSGSGGLGGAGGGGESELQLQQRRIRDRRKALLRRLEAVRKTRAVQRAGRKRSGKPQVAVVGYTNAGKSSLVGALSGSDVGAADQLFATLDPTLRRVVLPSGREAILSDTVGFISNLPVQLVEAFKATLEEVTQADLLLHVLDASSPHVLEQRAAVLHVLRELGVGQHRLDSVVLEVWNKADLLLDDADAGSVGVREEGTAAATSPPKDTGAGVLVREGRPGRWEREEGGPVPSRSSVAAAMEADPGHHPTAVVASAVRGEGLQELLRLIDSKLDALQASDCSSGSSSGGLTAEELAAFQRLQQAQPRRTGRQTYRGTGANRIAAAAGTRSSRSVALATS